MKSHSQASKNKRKEKKKRRAGSKLVKQQLISLSHGCYCHLCSQKMRRKEEIQMHHLIRLADGGLTTLENGSLLCEECHHIVHSFDNDPVRYEHLRQIIIKQKIERIAK